MKTQKVQIVNSMSYGIHSLPQTGFPAPNACQKKF